MFRATGTGKVERKSSPDHVTDQTLSMEINESAYSRSLRDVIFRPTEEEANPI